MNRLTSGMAPLFALLLVAGCTTEPTDDLRNGAARIDAAPSQVFLQLGETQTVDVTAVDDQGNHISSAYEVTSTGSGITVKRDSTFLPIFINDSTLSVPPEAPVFRFVVTATAYGASSFTVSADGKEITIPVQVIAQRVLHAQISNLEPALNEVVTITAPAGITFSATSQVTLADTTAVQPFTVAVSADGKSITFLPSPNINNAQLVITNVISEVAPTLTFAPATADRLTSPTLRFFDGTVSNFAPAANQPITVTLNNATLAPTPVVQVGAVPAIVIGKTANSATMLPVPGSSGQLIVNGVIIDSLPQFVLSLSTPETDSVKVGPVGAAAGTDDPSTTTASLAVPDPGFAAPFFDLPDFTATIDHFYKLVVPADGDYTITMDWDIGSDIDMFVCPEAGVATFDCDFTAATGDQPEEATYPLTAGTYFVVAEDFGGDAAGATVTITVAR